MLDDSVEDVEGTLEVTDVLLPLTFEVFVFAVDVEDFVVEEVEFPFEAVWLVILDPVTEGSVLDVFFAVEFAK